MLEITLNESYNDCNENKFFLKKYYIVYTDIVDENQFNINYSGWFWGN
jgi:hypothetical protein